MSRRWLLLAAPLAVAACGDDGGGDPGRVEGFVTDLTTAFFTGEIAGDMQVSISADGSAWYDLASPSGVTVPLQLSGSRTTVHGERDAPAGSYSRVRLIVSNARVRVNPTTIGGTVLTGTTEIPMGGSDGAVAVVVTVPSFDVAFSPARRHAITFTMNSAAWITEPAVQAMMVDDLAVQAAVTAAVTVEPRS